MDVVHLFGIRVVIASCALKNTIPRYWSRILVALPFFSFGFIISYFFLYCSSFSLSLPPHRLHTCEMCRYASEKAAFFFFWFRSLHFKRSLSWLLICPSCNQYSLAIRPVCFSNVWPFLTAVSFFFAFCALLLWESSRSDWPHKNCSLSSHFGLTYVVFHVCVRFSLIILGRSSKTPLVKGQILALKSYNFCSRAVFTIKGKV